MLYSPFRRARGATFAQNTAGHAQSGDLTDFIVPSDGSVVPIAVGHRNR